MLRKTNENAYFSLVMRYRQRMMKQAYMASHCPQIAAFVMANGLKHAKENTITALRKRVCLHETEYAVILRRIEHA